LGELIAPGVTANNITQSVAAFNGLCMGELRSTLRVLIALTGLKAV
jgi:hypothetical protein